MKTGGLNNGPAGRVPRGKETWHLLGPVLSNHVHPLSIQRNPAQRLFPILPGVRGTGSCRTSVSHSQKIFTTEERVFGRGPDIYNSSVLVSFESLESCRKVIR